MLNNKKNSVHFNAEKNVLTITCVLAVAALLYVTQTGDILLGGIALLVLAAGMEMKTFTRCPIAQ